MTNATIDAYVAQVEAALGLPGTQNQTSQTEVVNYVYSMGLSPCTTKAVILALTAKYPKIFTTKGKGKGKP